VRDEETRSAASLVLGPFVATLVVLRLVSPATAAQWAAADPLLHALPFGRGTWAIAASMLACGLQLRRRWPGRSARREAVRQALAGALAAALVIGVLRELFGAHLPSLIPPEESARPGLLLGLSAGVVEEAIFRLLVLPALLALATPRLGRAAAAVACLGTGLSFALSHQIAPGPWVARHFATRLLLPGAGMSALALWPGPAFLIAAHCTAHVLMPLAFR
jgi:CAAX prenyl protease-like protein